ncbi:short-chain dehydrogenase/reductase family oxidoreductase [Streptomyces sp. e14]|uniref:SDR family oxidoreductase n=1 Tax=Streptomyces sp. e14 TaxID=645465 RepID=UPI0001D06A61|nr:short-chain dehydrogenase/reductase family oxidoreductase [Streptomyces sp. e14]
MAAPPSPSTGRCRRSGAAVVRSLIPARLSPAVRPRRAGRPSAVLRPACPRAPASTAATNPFSTPVADGRHGDAAALWSAFDAQIPQHAPEPAVDVIVNNAGIGCGADLASLTEDGFDEVFAVNVRAHFFIVREGLKRLRDAGRIINISSGAAHLAMPEAIAYGATKSALDNFTLNLAKELGARGITANSVAPGIIDTDVNAGWLRGNPEAEAHAASLAALGRVGRPEDVADIVAFLASDDARWVTGKVIDATGGSGL